MARPISIVFVVKSASASRVEFTSKLLRPQGSGVSWPTDTFFAYFTQADYNSSSLPVLRETWHKHHTVNTFIFYSSLSMPRYFGILSTFLTARACPYALTLIAPWIGFPLQSITSSQSVFFLTPSTPTRSFHFSLRPLFLAHQSRRLINTDSMLSHGLILLHSLIVSIIANYRLHIPTW